jgi:hypothetical protein
MVKTANTRSIMIEMPIAFDITLPSIPISSIVVAAFYTFVGVKTLTNPPPTTIPTRDPDFPIWIIIKIDIPTIILILQESIIPAMEMKKIESTEVVKINVRIAARM